MRILILSSRCPYPTVKGNQLRLLYQLRFLSRRHEVALITTDDGMVSSVGLGPVEELATTTVVQMSPTRWLRALSAPLAGRPAQVSYYRSRAFAAAVQRAAEELRPDVAVVQLSRMAMYEPVLRAAGVERVVLDLVDSLALNQRSLAAFTAPPISWLRWIESQLVARFERAVLPRFDAITVVAEADRTFLGDPRIVVNPLGVQRSRPVVPMDEREPATLLFFGNMSYPPNVQAVTELVREVLPKVHAVRSDVRVRIVGATPSRAVLRLTSDSVEVSGYVSDLEAELDRATLAVLPLRSGSGMHGKVLEALVAGLPVITTPFVLGGVRAQAGVELLVGETSDQLARHVLTLLADTAARRRLSEAGRGLVERRYSWERSVEQFEGVVQRVVGRRAR